MTEVRYRNFWGESKRADLLASLDQQPEDFEASYQIVDPRAENRFAFRPRELGVTYQSWPTVRELCEAEPFSGAQEMRKGRLMGVDRAELEARMTRYADPSRNLAQLIADGDGPADTTDQFDAERARSRLLAAGPDGQFQIRRYALHPFDNLWCAWTPVASLWNRPRPELAREVDGRNRMFITRMVAERPHEQHPMIMTAALPDYHLLRPNVVAVPIMLTPAPARGDLLDEAVAAEPRANLSARARRYLADLGLADPDADQTVREAIWFHALAIGYSPAWLADSGEAIRQDWPRVPLPATAELLLASADLGRQVTVLNRHGSSSLAALAIGGQGSTWRHSSEGFQSRSQPPKLSRQWNPRTSSFPPLSPCLPGPSCSPMRLKSNRGPVRVSERSLSSQ